MRCFLCVPRTATSTTFPLSLHPPVTQSLYHSITLSHGTSYSCVRSIEQPPMLGYGVNSAAGCAALCADTGSLVNERKARRCTASVAVCKRRRAARCGCTTLPGSRALVGSVVAVGGPCGCSAGGETRATRRTPSAFLPCPWARMRYQPLLSQMIYGSIRDTRSNTTIRSADLSTATWRSCSLCLSSTRRSAQSTAPPAHTAPPSTPRYRHLSIMEDIKDIPKSVRPRTQRCVTRAPSSAVPQRPPPPRPGCGLLRGPVRPP